MRDDLPSGTVTFLFTDVEGSTRLLHELGADQYAEALAEHRRVIRKACAGRDGVEVDTQGDAFFFAFPAAPGAAEAARAVTEALADGPIQIRIGLHTGTPLLTEEGYVGDDIHFGARVAACGHGGQVLLSSTTAAAIAPSGSEPQALPLLDLGEHRLKDIESAVSIFQLGEGTFPPLKTISNTNLPRPASSFVGREAEVAEVLSRIEQGARLLTLSGPGGSGKTRLALEAVATLVPEYKAGVFWVGLASLRDPALVTETISQTLGAKDGLAEHIGERELLLLLDNLEQVIEAAPELSALLSACSNLTLLVTSRELLRVQGEVEYPVPPLASPEAVSLFCERSQLEPYEEIAELCARLDNLPLAVELAAARTKALTPAQILERLSQRLDFLKGGRDADPRQQTLRSTLEWSYDLLSRDEKQLFARLSVFSGGCTLQAAEEVADADVDTLQSLVEKSLLRFSNERYWMLETIREYASERLEEEGQAESFRHRLAKWSLALAEEADGALRGPLQLGWLDCLDAELENLRAALAWALGGGAPLLGSRIASALFWFWQLRSHLGEGNRWLAQAVALGADLPMELRARLVQGRGQLTYYSGDTADLVVATDAATAATVLLEDAARLWRESQSARPLAETLAYLGIAAGEAGDAQRSLSALEESVAVARRVGEGWTLGFALWALGATKLLGTAGPVDLERAALLLEESAEWLGPTEDCWALAGPLFYLGEIASKRGDSERAWELIEEAAKLVRAIGDKWRLTSALKHLAALAEKQGNHDAASRLKNEAEMLEHELGRLRKPERMPA